MLLEPIALDLQPGGCATSRRVGGFSWQSASSVFVFPGEHTLRARARRATSPAEVKVAVARAGAGARADPPGQTTRQARSRQRRRRPRRSPPTARAIGRVPGTVDVPAGERTLTFKAPRYLDHVERVDIAGGGEKQKLKVALKPNFGVVSISSVPAGAQIEVDGKPAGVTPAKVEMDSGIRRVQVSAPGLRVWTSSVAVNAGVPQNIGPDRARRRRRARHACARCPSGAQVTTGGSFRGVTPLTIELAPGVSHVDHRGARRLCAVDARSFRRGRQGIARSTRGSRRCW